LERRIIKTPIITDSRTFRYTEATWAAIAVGILAGPTADGNEQSKKERGKFGGEEDEEACHCRVMVAMRRRL